MDKFVVPSLYDLSFVVSYKSIAKTVASFRDYQPGDKRPADVLDASQNLTYEEVSSCVRGHLNDHLFGRISVKIRLEH